MAFPEHIRSITAIVDSIWNDESNQNERLHRLFMAAGWQAWKRIVRTSLTVRLFNGMRFRAYPGCTSSSAAFYTRIPNSRPIQFLRQHLRGGTLIDVGANVGLVSLLLADKIQHALLFEPNPGSAARALENIALNHLAFEVHAVALSDQTGTVRLENAGGASPVNRTVVGFDTSVPTITVPRITFDDFLLKHPPLPAPIGAVKIDVEGHENSVLRGMLATLQTHRPPLVMFEYLERTNLKETLQIFTSVGYRVIALTSKGSPTWATPEVEPMQDLFACPEELSEEFEENAGRRSISNQSSTPDSSVAGYQTG